MPWGLHDAELERRVAVGAVPVHQPQVSAAVAKEHEVLAEPANRERKLADLRAHRDRMPEAPQVLSARRVRPDPDQKLVGTGRRGLRLLVAAKVSYLVVHRRSFPPRYFVTRSGVSSPPTPGWLTDRWRRSCLDPESRILSPRGKSRAINRALAQCLLDSSAGGPRFSRPRALVFGQGRARPVHAQLPVRST